MQTTTPQAEIGLAELDDNIAHADRNIRQVGSLLPQLADKGHATAEIEDKLILMTKALHCLRAERRSILETLEGDEPLPRIAVPARARRQAATLTAAAVVPSHSATGWRAIYMRLRRT
jgi:hypothetical protein